MESTERLEDIGEAKSIEVYGRRQFIKGALVTSAVACIGVAFGFGLSTIHENGMNSDPFPCRYQNRDFCLLPNRNKDGCLELYFVKPNPVWIQAGDLLVVGDYRNPSLEESVQAISSSSVVDHLVGHRVKEQVGDNDSGVIYLDWHNGFDFTFHSNKIYEGQRADVLTISNPDYNNASRSVSYIDLDKSGVVNRIHLSGYLQDEGRIKTFGVEDLDAFERHRSQEFITKEYAALLQNMQKLSSEWDMYADKKTSRRI